MKVGLLFGSFNPVHVGHLILANYMATNTDLDQVWFVVSPQNPLKPSHTLLHEQDRIELVRLAIDDNANLSATDIEFSMPRPSYTIDTLVYLKQRYPSYEFALIMGEDNLPTLPKWKNYEQLLADYEIYVYPRSKTPDTVLRSHPKVKLIPAPNIDISATFIRETIKAGKSIRYLVPEEVENYIRVKKLWQ